MSNLLKRTISGIIFMGIMLAAMLVNRYLFGAVMLSILCMMMFEFLRMTMGKSYPASQVLSIVAGAMLFILSFCHTGLGASGLLYILVFIPMFVMMANAIYVKDRQNFGKYAFLYTALLYIAVPWALMNYAVFYKAADGSIFFNGHVLLGFFCIIWGSDVGAYIFGCTLGQKFGGKLCPDVSPKKSWVGFWGGLLTAILVSILMWGIKIFDFSIVHCIVLAVVMNIAGVYGDLIESQWKRYCETKDSGIAMPGHGGMLDRFDSALMAIPVGAIYLLIFNLMEIQL